MRPLTRGDSTLFREQRAPGEGARGAGPSEGRLSAASSPRSQPALLSPNPMTDTLHLHLTHQELKDLLRRRFSRAGLEPPILEAIEEIALLIHRHGFPRDRGAPGTRSSRALRPPSRAPG